MHEYLEGYKKAIDDCKRVIQEVVEPMDSYDWSLVMSELVNISLPDLLDIQTQLYGDNEGSNQGVLQDEAEEGV